VSTIHVKAKGWGEEGDERIPIILGII